MSIEIVTGQTFEKRLAELAWEHADELTRATLASTVALSIASSKTAVSKLHDAVLDKIIEHACSAAISNTQLDATISSATERALQDINSDSWRAHVVSEATNAALKLIASSVKKASKESLSSRIICETAMEAINKGVCDAVAEIINPESNDVVRTFSTVVQEQLRKLKHLVPVNRNVTDHIERTLKDI